MNNITIVFPFYNVEKYVKRSLLSVLNQDDKNFDLIIINDGSTDKSEEIVLDLIKNKNNIKYISQKNKGISKTRNIGIENTKTEYIYFIDSDDFIEKKLISILNKSLLKNSDIDIVIFGFNVIKKNQKIKKNPQKTEIYSQSEMRKIFPYLIEEIDLNSVWNKIYRKQLLVGNDIYFDDAIKISEDSIFNAQAFSIAEIVMTIDSIFYNYILERPQSAMANINIEIVINKIKAIKYWEDLLIFFGHDYNIRDSKIINIIYYELRKIAKSDVKYGEKRLIFKELLNNEQIVTELKKINIFKKIEKKLKLKLLIIKFFVKLY